jgi:hypothetical protein
LLSSTNAIAVAIGGPECPVAGAQPVKKEGELISKLRDVLNQVAWITVIREGTGSSVRKDDYMALLMLHDVGRVWQ